MLFLYVFILFIICCVCGLHGSVLSYITPRYFVVVFHCSLVLYILLCTLCFLLLLVTFIILHFFGFILVIYFLIQTIIIEGSTVYVLIYRVNGYSCVAVMCWNLWVYAIFNMYAKYVLYNVGVVWNFVIILRKLVYFMISQYLAWIDRFFLWWRCWLVSWEGLVCIISPSAPMYRKLMWCPSSVCNLRLCYLIMASVSSILIFQEYNNFDVALFFWAGYEWFLK